MSYYRVTNNYKKLGDVMSFGRYLKKLRENKGLSLRETARLSKMSGSYLSQLENGHNTNPKKDILMRLSSTLEVPYVDMLMQTEIMNINKDILMKNLKGDENKITEHYERSKLIKDEHEEMIRTFNKLVEGGYVTSHKPTSKGYVLDDLLSDKFLIQLDSEYLTNDEKKEVLNYARFIKKK